MLTSGFVPAKVIMSTRYNQNVYVDITCGRIVYEYQRIADSAVIMLILVAYYDVPG